MLCLLEDSDLPLFFLVCQEANLQTQWYSICLFCTRPCDLIPRAAKNNVFGFSKNWLGLKLDQAVPYAAPAQGRQRQEDYLSQIFPVNRDNTAESNRTIITSQARLWGTVQDCRLKNKKSPATLAQHPSTEKTKAGPFLCIQGQAGYMLRFCLKNQQTAGRTICWFELDSSWKQLEIDVIMEWFTFNPIFPFSIG